ncbi:class II aldolase/adducin family protein [Methylobacterium oryzae CBMB20]
MVLRNHGLLTCGRTVGEAFRLMHNMERSCRAQLAIQAAGAPVIRPSAAVATKTAGQYAAGYDRVVVQGRPTTSGRRSSGCWRGRIRISSRRGESGTVAGRQFGRRAPLRRRERSEATQGSAIPARLALLDCFAPRARTAVPQSSTGEGMRRQSGAPVPAGARRRGTRLTPPPRRCSTGRSASGTR